MKEAEVSLRVALHYIYEDETNQDETNIDDESVNSEDDTNGDLT